MERTIFTQEHEDFRQLCRNFIAKEFAPRFEEFEKAGRVDKAIFTRMGELGLTGMQVPEEYGGGGQTSFFYNAILNEESGYAATTLDTLQVHQDLVIPYILRYGTEEQKQRWLPSMADATLMSAIAMTEPGTGSDLTGIRTRAEKRGDHYVLNGAKTFITGGVNADLVLVVARTAPFDPDNRRAGMSLLAVETNSEGFEVSRQLDKIGLKSQDTAELSFTDVRVPVENLLGEEGEAFGYLSHNLPQERMTIAVNAMAAAQAAIRFATDYAHEREVFGSPLKDFQNTKFVLAECSAEATAGQVLTDQALVALDAGTLTPADAARVKLFTTEAQGRIIDKCLQIHGGYGYILEYPIARLYANARVSRIFGGTSEVMKTIIAKDLGLSAARS